MQGRARWRAAALVPAMAAAALAGCAQRTVHESEATLGGAQCVPANSSAASASSTLRVLPDLRVTGSVRYTGMTATSAQLHAGPAGANGPVVVALHRTGEGTFAAPPDMQLTPAQYRRYLAGEVYVSVQSALYTACEIRAQLRP